MAVKADLLTEVKSTLNISVSTFDTDLNADLDSAVKDLSRKALREVAPSDTTVAADGRTITLPAGLDSARRIEIDGYSEDFFCHAGSAYLTQGANPGDTATVFGLARYAIASYADIPDDLESVIINWAISKFYNALAGNKRKYNIYVGASGSAADRDMKDSALHFKDLGDEYLIDASPVRGF